MAQLHPGDKAPLFELQGQDNNIIKLSDYSGQKLIVYFYPKADTPGCTKQACSVRDARPDLTKLGVAAVGISPDKAEKQKKFDEKYNLGFSLLSDPNHTVADAWGVWGEKSMYGKKYEGIIRSLFLVDENGIILRAWYKISPKDTIPEAMKAIRG
ncbi:MAG: thioredoxin-dependent thiol peroxidase [Candidatus Latescibacteria bacterium]|jgi:thioredoxin-dependent peroxiredoxin|nr:thioredoxin-dependent thiol peroxidase [Candidatus Latescibacterota bacterium]